MAVSGTEGLNLHPWPMGDASLPHGLVGARPTATGDASGGDVTLSISLSTASKDRIIYFTGFGFSIGAAGGTARLRLLNNHFTSGNSIELMGETLPAGHTHSAWVYSGSGIWFRSRLSASTTILQAVAANTNGDTYLTWVQGYYWDEAVLRAAGVAPRLI